MAQIRTAQVTIEPEEYRRLESLAEQRGVSVSDLVHAAVRDYLSHSANRREIVQEILRLEVPIEEDWDQIEEEISRAHADGLP